ncbi:MAG: hypothetical protein HY226_05405 [Candidatus Vogelbacteria bacterium]|nr:hypothetical protein [Candidatus Vogelbacteria bacterium]
MKPEKRDSGPDLTVIKGEIKTMIEQKLGMAAMQTEMIEAIRSNPDLSKDDLWYIAFKHLKPNDTPIYDQAKTLTTIEHYIALHEAVSTARKNFPNDPDLFKYLFNHEPQGKIEIKTGPIVIYVRCYDMRDFGLAFRDNPSDDQPLSPVEMLHASLVGGKFLRNARQPELTGTLVIENGLQREDKAAFEHEEQHAIKNLFEGEERESYFTGQEDIMNKKQASKMVQNFLIIYRKNHMETLAKHEILAYMKTGQSSQETYRDLTQPKKDGGIYDYAASYIPYLKELSQSWRPIFQDALTDELLRKVFEDEYWKVVASGCRAFNKLIEKVKLSRQDTVNLLTVEPLSKWEKLAERIIEYEKNS